MANKATRFLKSIFKIALWVTGIIVTLFFCIILLLRIPAVQIKLGSEAGKILSKKTGAEIKLKRLSILFPSDILLEDLLVKDHQRDTLVYAAEIKLNPDIPGLLKNHIHFTSISLNSITAKLTRSTNDILFNFNFLFTSLSDTTKKKTGKTEAPAKWLLSIDNIKLKKIHFIFDDKHGGTFSVSDLKALELTFKKLDLAKKIFHASTLLVNSLSEKVILTESKNIPSSTTESQLPLISADQIDLVNNKLSYLNHTTALSIETSVNHFLLTKAKLNLNSKRLEFDKLLSEKNTVNITTSGFQNTSDPVSGTNSNEEWSVAGKEISIDGNKIDYSTSKKITNNYFDPDHFHYKNIFLNANNCYYSRDSITAQINSFSAADPGNFQLEQLKTMFLMTGKTISAKGLIIKTNQSNVNAAIEVNFSSLKYLKDTLKNISLFTNFKNSTIHSADILYFFPQLIKQPFFKNAIGSIAFSGIVKGPLNYLKGENISVQTAKKTNLRTSFLIEGLPDLKHSYFNFPDLIIHSGMRDLENILGRAVLPKKIGIPSDIDLRLKFEGTLKAFKTVLVFQSDFGKINLSGEIDHAENFIGTAQLFGFNAGKLLKNEEIFGPVSLVLNVKGHGIDPKNINTSITASATEFFLKQYTYQGLNISGDIAGKLYHGSISLKDSNAEFDLNGSVNLEEGNEQYKLNLNVKAADLKKLQLTKEDFKVAFSAVTDLKGKNISAINGNAGITNIFLAHNNDKYSFDSVLFAAINEKGRSELNVKSAILGIKYHGTFAPADLVEQVRKNINEYFPFETENLKYSPGNEIQNFNFEIHIRNHPVLSEVFFPMLKEFEPGVFKGSFNGEKKELSLNIPIKKLKYGNLDVTDFLFTIGSDPQKLNYRMSVANAANSQFSLDNFLIDGNLSNKKVATLISSISKNNYKRLMLQSEISREKENYKIRIAPEEIFLMNEPWMASADNYLLIGPKTFLIHNFELIKSKSKISITSVNNKANGDIKALITNFQLGDISRIFEKDTILADGTVNADLLLKRINNKYGVVTDLKITDLTVHDILIGNLELKAENPTPENFVMNLQLNGTGNNIRAEGFFSPQKETNALNLDLDITSLSASAIEAFLWRRVSKTSGNIRGRINLQGTFKEPRLNGSLNFENVFVKPAFLNHIIQLKNETIKISDNEIQLNSFTVLDKTDHPAVIDGTIKMNHISDFEMDLNITTKDFLLLNTTVKNNPEYYGRLIIDSKVKLKGSAVFPVINSSIKLKKGSHFTFAVPKSELTTDKGENVVLFTDSLNINPILRRSEKKEVQKSAVRNLNISSTIEIDNKAILRILPDPGSKDSLAVKGDAALAFVSDAGGKNSLTGAYYLKGGSYLVSLENVVKKQFKIENGSTIIWTGDILNPEININAVYSIRTSPIDLIADQSLESYRSSFGQSYLFLVYMKLKGPLLHPELSFEIQLAKSEKGTLGNTINAKLNQLNENPSALNKQVFALLVLNRFIQENPFQSEADPASSVARTTAGKFLSDQLNKLSSKFIPGINLNFNVQSYNEYSSGQAQGRTQVEVGLSKQLFNERVNVQIGGSVDVEGEKTKQNSASDVAGDVNVEYKVTKDGRYRLKSFRHNQYEGVIEGQVTETGTGLLYVYDFNKWLEIFLKEKKKTPVKDSSGVNQLNK
jgi:hypothetical protein